MLLRTRTVRGPTMAVSCTPHPRGMGCASRLSAYSQALARVRPSSRDQQAHLSVDLQAVPRCFLVGQNLTKRTDGD